MSQSHAKTLSQKKNQRKIQRQNNHIDHVGAFWPDMVMKLIQFILSLFKSKPSTPTKPVDTGNQSPTNSLPAVNPDLVKILKLFQHEFSLIAGAKEIGSNTDKGGRIDTIIKEAGGRLGWPYCALTVTAVTMRVCKQLGIGFPKGLKATASSQSIKNDCDRKYLLTRPKPWSAFVHTNPDDKAHGHTGFATDEANFDGEFPTAEGNFQQQVNYFKKNLSYAKVFVDYPQAVLDQYVFEKGK